MASTTKRDHAASPTDVPSPKEQRLASSPAASIHEQADAEALLREGAEIEADDEDSVFVEGSVSDGTSIRSSITRGFIENGRRYATLRGEGKAIIPSDEKQFEVFETTHLMYLILDSQRREPLFQSPIGKKAQNVLDIGTGDGTWALEVADKYPNLTVHGIDLFPPPKTWVAPNCILEVDDALKPWTFNKRFDLIHIRLLNGSFSHDEWRRLYKQAYENLAPGGWMELLEQDPEHCCDDGTMPADSYLAKNHKLMVDSGNNANRPLTMIYDMQRMVEETGFVNVHKTDYKFPIGEWPKLQVYKDAGRVALNQIKNGIEGWILWLLTKYGTPKPWSVEEVQVYLSHLRKDVDSKWHIYQRAKRVWAQKPFDA